MHFLVDTLAGLERGLRSRSMKAYDYLLRTLYGGGHKGAITDLEGRTLVVANHLLNHLHAAAAATGITPAPDPRDFTFHDLSPDEVDIGQAWPFGAAHSGSHVRLFLDCVWCRGITGDTRLLGRNMGAQHGGFLSYRGMVDRILW